MKPRAANKKAHRKTLSPSESRALKADQRLALVKRYHELLLEGKTPREAATLAGASRSTIWRIETALSEHDLAGLEPHTANCGRKSALSTWNIAEPTVAAVARIAREQQCSVRAAWLKFAVTTECPPTLSPRLLKHVPPSLINAVRKLNT
ncbi:MAG TPA: hypothetical protein VK530_04185 [Candidatus Acidoferrum sp.]|nr:hypothetical protein [Candidatus Acidoferrum sp.]